jgi:hypothetical protein
MRPNLLEEEVFLTAGVKTSGKAFFLKEIIDI